MLTALTAALLLNVATQTPPAAPETPPSFHWAVAGGIGDAYDFGGFHVEARHGHWAGFLGTGLPLSAGPSRVAGIKWFPRLDGAGLFTSLHVNFSFSTPDPEVDDYDRLVVVAANVGWRFKSSAFFVELALGPALSFARIRPAAEPPTSPRGARWDWGPGSVGPEPDVGPGWLPDISLAIGFEI